MAYERIFSRGTMWVEERAIVDARIAIAEARAECAAVQAALGNASRIIAAMEKERRDLVTAIIARLGPVQAMPVLSSQNEHNENPS